jgi:hypothetical protein
MLDCDWSSDVCSSDLNIETSEALIPANTVTKTIVVNRYSIVACARREFRIFPMSILSVTAAFCLVNNRPMK